LQWEVQNPNPARLALLSYTAAQFMFVPVQSESTPHTFVQTELKQTSPCPQFVSAVQVPPAAVAPIATQLSGPPSSGREHFGAPPSSAHPHSGATEQTPPPGRAPQHVPPTQI
jgi:hypothetical protein